MDRMDVFSDTVNESFGYEEVEWQGNTYMVDFNSKESVEKLLSIITGKSYLDDCLSSLINFNDQPEFLNKLIGAIPSKILDSTVYQKFHEESGDENWVLYRVDLFRPMIENEDTNYLLYRGASYKPPQPINISSTYNMFSSVAGVYRNELSTLDLSHWDVSHVKDMSAMFYACTKLESLNVTDWDMSNVQDMAGMFNSNEKLKDVDISGWNTSNVQTMAGMFCWCKAIDFDMIKDWNVSNVQTMTEMFSWCSNIKSLNVSHWDVKNVTDMSGMFRHCADLVELDLSMWELQFGVDTDDMFYSCTSLVTTHNADLDKLLGGK